MQIVIEIPEDAYNYIKANGARIPYYKLTDAIKNGIVLPKGHSRLIDAYDIKGFCVEIAGNLTNGDMIKAMFPSCKDWKARIEDNDGEVYEVHFAQLPNSMTVNKYEESWWNSPYEGGEK